MRERETIALSGLLHDIGKLLQRAGRGNLLPFSDDRRREYVYEHAHLTAAFLDLLKDKGIIDEVLRGKLDRWGARHHNPTDELESVVIQIADWYSSAEREEILKSEFNNLHSVFERVSLIPKEDRRSVEEYAPQILEDLPEELRRFFGIYDLKPLSIREEIIFPKTFYGGIVKEEIAVEGKKKTFYTIRSFKSVDVEGKYSALFKDFIEELKKTTLIGDKKEAFFNTIFYLLYKYTWCVPASTFDIKSGSRHYPDISLFDHSRVLSAIAVSLYDWAKANNKSAEDIKPKSKELITDNEEIFLLVEGDIGGIQQFIYNIHKSSESELSIAKALRGRSFFLNMLPEVIARYILKNLSYPITNALYIGGGKFQLLIGNTKNNESTLERVEKEINKWFFREFHGELSLSLARLTMKGEVLRNKENGDPSTYLDHIEELDTRLENEKRKKFKELLYKEFPDDEHEAGKICNSCRTLPVEKEDLCKWCLKSEEWGSVLPRIKYIAFDLENRDVKIDDGRKTMKFGNFGKVYLLEDGDDLEKVKDLPEVLSIEDTKLIIEENKIVNGFKFLGHITPKAPEDEGLLSKLNDIIKDKRKEFKKKDKLEKGDVLPFDLLSEFAQGDKKLGFLRADVDYLGLIFSDGLRFNEFGEKEIYTISRVASLSRLLDLFFSGYLNRLVQEVSYRYIKEKLKELEERKDELSQSERQYKELLESVLDTQGEKLKIESLIYTVYSGGDDLFIIAPYDIALEFAKELREKFKKYTCENPDFGISAGLFIGKHTTPIHLVAKFSGKLEDSAKDFRREKDAIGIFNTVLAWNKEIERNIDEGRKGISLCYHNSEDNKKSEKEKEKLLDLNTTLEIVGKFCKFNRNSKITRGLYHRLLNLWQEFVNEDRIDLRIYPRIYYYVGRNVKDKDVRSEIIDTLLNGIGGSNDVRVVIRNLNVILSLVLMKTRGGV